MNVIPHLDCCTYATRLFQLSRSARFHVTTSGCPDRYASGAIGEKQTAVQAFEKYDLFLKVNASRSSNQAKKTLAAVKREGSDWSDDYLQCALCPKENNDKRCENP